MTNNQLLKKLLLESVDFNKLTQIVKNFGPVPEEYGYTYLALSTLGANWYTKVLPENVFNDLWNELGDHFKKNTIIGRVYAKPLGYAGDYTVIEDFYTQKEDGLLGKWDKFAHAMVAPAAVRNRKEYFKDLVKDNKHKNILNIASGPCRDVFEALQDGFTGHITCVDQDHSAIEYAKNVCKGYESQLTFVERNAFKFKSTEKFDLVWSAGLFDYLDDKCFTKLLEKFKTLVNSNGEIVVGNFSDRNPTIWLMEFAEWTLNHRSDEDLLQLAQNAGLTGEVKKEPLGVNSFLHAS
jgi:hypothetical protein